MNKKELENQPMTIDRAKEKINDLVKELQEHDLKIKVAIATSSSKFNLDNTNDSF